MRVSTIGDDRQERSTDAWEYETERSEYERGDQKEDGEAARREGFYSSRKRRVGQPGVLSPNGPTLA